MSFNTEKLSISSFAIFMISIIALDFIANVSGTNSYISSASPLEIGLIIICILSFISFVIFTLIYYKEKAKIRKYELDSFKKEICINCGARIQGNDNFCQNWGNKLPFSEV